MHPAIKMTPMLSRLQQTIERARYVLEEITCLQGSHHKLFQWNFVRLAEAFRRVRIVLGLGNIEEMYSLKLALYHLMRDAQRGEPQIQLCQIYSGSEHQR